MFAIRKHRRSRRPLAMVGVLAFVAGFVAAPVARAGQTDTIDPAVMQPALNPEFAPWTCWRADSKIICEGSKTWTYGGLEVDFLSCPTGPIYSEGTASSTARRVGDANGRALETTFRDRYEETFSAEGTDVTLRSIGRLQVNLSYGIAGDPATVAATLAGMAISVTGPGFGAVMHDVGTVAWDSEGALLRFGGVHPPAFSAEEWQETHDRICSAFFGS